MRKKNVNNACRLAHSYRFHRHHRGIQPHLLPIVYNNVVTRLSGARPTSRGADRAARNSCREENGLPVFLPHHSATRASVPSGSTTCKGNFEAALVGLTLP